MDWIGYGAKQRSKRGVSGVGRKGIVPSVDRASGEGKGRFIQRIYASNIPDDSKYDDALPVQENSFAQEVRQSSYRRTGGTPIRTLIDEEISKESDIRRRSPSLVARLMGLDTLPAHSVQKKHNVMDICPHDSFSGFQDKYVSFEDHSARKTSDEHEDIKDVYEIAEKSKSEKQKYQSNRRGISYSRRSDIKYGEAKHLSAAEMLQKPHELDDMVEISDLNKDPFLKFLQEPNSLFSKHLQDLKGAPPTHASHITILKSSRGRDAQHSELCLQSERGGRRHARVRVDDVAYFSKPASRHDHCSLKERKSPLAHMLSKSDYGVEADGCRHPTQIVVLKPRLSKVHKTARPVNLPRYKDDFRFDYKWREETLMSVIREVHAKGRALRKSLDDMQFMSDSAQGSRDVAREIMEQMKQSINYGTQMKRKKRIVRSHVNSEEFQCTLNDNSSSSSSYSTKTSTFISREDKKGLSEKWNMTKPSLEMGLVDKASGTLGEMLALSVMETPNAFLNNIATKKDERLTKSGVISRQGLPYGFCDNDAWEERCTRKLQRSVSAPSSSGTRCKDAENKNSDCYMPKDMLNLRDDDFILEPIDQMGSLSCRSFRCQRISAAQFDVCGEVNIIPERERNVNLEEFRNMAYKSHYPNKGMIFEPSEDDRRHLVHDSPVPGTRTSSHVTSEQLNTSDTYGYHSNNFTIKETSGLQVEQPVSSHLHSVESRPSSGSKESEQPSPVSVLDPTSEEENSSSGCFERVCADLKELRRQLRRLKLESLDTDSEQSELIVSDDDAVGESHYTTNAGTILQSFKDEADRDFSYVLDVLIDSGVNGTDLDMLSDPFLKVKYPVQLNVFDNLEKKYSFLLSWPKSERRHLFDLTNSVLAEISTASRGLHPWMKQDRTFMPILSHDDLIEKVWQMVVKNRKEPIGNLENFLELKWLNLEEDVELIGMDIEGMLQEDLLEDLVVEIMLE